MAYTTINDPSEYFHTQLYTGDGSSSNAITNDANAGDFKPDWLWIKCRSEARDHQVTDSTRGGNIGLRPNSNIGEFSGASTQFDSDGFTLTDSSNTINGSSKTYVAWQWKANGGTTSSNTDGGITSTVQANTEAGFSIVTYTGTGSATTVGHGLGIVPSWYVVKRRSAAEGWTLYHHKNTSAPETDHLLLESTSGTNDQADIWNDTAPTSSVFSLGNNSATNASSSTYIAYCFSEVKGYSKFGFYQGTGRDDGPFVYTGFKPSWIMIKRTDTTEHWKIHDATRNPFNEVDETLYANLTNSTDTVSNTANTDFLSNGFKCRGSGGQFNASSGTYIYFAFAEHPYVSSKGVPVTAR